MKTMSLGLALLLVCALGLPIALPGEVDADQLMTERVQFSVHIRDGVSVLMSAVVVTRSHEAGHQGATVLAVHGLAQTANTFMPLAEALLSDHAGRKLSRLVLLDMPGHGGSGFPIGVGFGDLTLDDYVTALLESLGVFRPEVLLGHSLGAELIVLAQQRLHDAQQTLRGSFGVQAAVLLAPSIPAPLPWAFSAIAGTVLDQLGLVHVRPTGAIVITPPAIWVALLYSDRTGTIVPGATTPDEAVAEGYIAVEPALSTAQLFGLPPFPGRPEVAPGLFRREAGTLVSVVDYEQDQFAAFPERQDLYVYLTGDPHLKRFVVIEGPRTVHNLHVLDPGALLDHLDDVLKVRRRDH